MRVIVVGAGVIGLSVAVRLAEAGHAVGVLARDLPPETTSAIAAALWYPYRALPRDAVTRWSAATYAELSRLAGTHPESGVAVRWGTELLRGPETTPWWRAAVPHVEHLACPPDGFSGGWRLPVPVTDMSVYLPWLVGRLESLRPAPNEQGGAPPDHTGRHVNQHAKVRGHHLPARHGRPARRPARRARATRRGRLQERAEQTETRRDVADRREQRG